VRAGRSKDGHRMRVSVKEFLFLYAMEEGRKKIFKIFKIFKMIQKGRV
jgi:hypothetical protein